MILRKETSKLPACESLFPPWLQFFILTWEVAWQHRKSFRQVWNQLELNLLQSFRDDAGTSHRPDQVVVRDRGRPNRFAVPGTHRPGQEVGAEADAAAHRAREKLAAVEIPRPQRSGEVVASESSVPVKILGFGSETSDEKFGRFFADSGVGGFFHHSGQMLLVWKENCASSKRAVFLAKP